MDFGGFLLFGLVALTFLLYAPYAIYAFAKRKRLHRLHLSVAGAMLLFLLVLGGWLYYIYGLNEPLAGAAADGDVTRVRSLLARGASPNAEGPDGSFTALIAAAENGHAEIVRLLLDRGADINRRDFEGKTALDRAREAGHAEIVQILERAGAGKK